MKMIKKYINQLLSDFFAKIDENHKCLQSHDKFSQRHHEKLLSKLDNIEKAIENLEIEIKKKTLKIKKQEEEILEELREKKIVKYYYFDKGVLTITFYTLFAIEIYGKENLFTFDRLDELYEKALKEKG